MSRSFKKVPKGASTHSESEKYDKKKWHKRLRQKTKQMITSTRYDESKLDETVLPIVHDVSDPWTMSKDGKPYYARKLRFGDVFSEWLKKIRRK